MTREDVRAQLAKNPMVWRIIHDGTTSYNRMECIHRTNRVKIFDNILVYYTIRIYSNWGKGSSLRLEGRLFAVIENKEAELLDGDKPDEFMIGESSKKANAFEPCRIEKLESMAEDHRLGLVCRLLGIND